MLLDYRASASAVVTSLNLKATDRWQLLSMTQWDVNAAHSFTVLARNSIGNSTETSFATPVLRMYCITAMIRLYSCTPATEH